ncbi:site-specific integrase [Marinomonas aquiplantarum]|uniref:Site-specific recombinase XerD n=1 Tax=Marinomonas aquiplantarum TaxID=491951 RepID=A0A366CZZ3_9GAMM|nr:site-specific integrase [Marinomonas aquiplantarum]RBO82588.1 site-specific recombinase XerD [Marinomonas aquiplantarum]
MASFRKRKKKDGTDVVYAQIRIKKQGNVVFSESEAFEGRNAQRDAELWANVRESEIKRRLDSGKSLVQLSVAEGMSRYLAEHENAPNPLGKTKHNTMLLMSKEAMLGEVALSEIKAADLLLYFRKRYHEDGAAAATVMQDASYIRVLAKYARVAWSIPIDLQEIDDAVDLGGKMGVIDRSTQRTRRPTLDEVKAICSYSGRTKTGRGCNTKHVTPLEDVVLFAIFSTRRLGEICRMEWNDVDFEEGTVEIKDMKHPRKKKGNNVILHLPGRALEIIKRQPRAENEPRIFPYHERTIGTAYQRACKFADIEDLTFHDLRHEGVSHLFELGYSIPQVSMISGHRSWANLSRYTHLGKLDKFDKYDGFEFVNGLGEAGLVKPT